MSPHDFLILEKFGAQMDRSLAFGATGGSLSALVIRFLSGLAAEPLPLPFDGPHCPICVESLLQWEHWDLPSLLVGLCCGLAIGPALDLLFLARQSWKIWLQGRFEALDPVVRRPQALYKIL